MPGRHQKRSRQNLPALPTGRFKTLYEAALRPAKADSGTSYEVSQSIIDQVASPTQPKQRRQTINERDAAFEIYRHNEPDKQIPEHSLEVEAIARLNELFSRRDAELGPDLILKAFRDLDAVFFNGHLLRYVQVRWSPSVTHMGVYGHVEHGEMGTARIIMDANKCFLQCREPSPYPEIFATLLHEMTHTLSYVKAHDGHAACDAECPHHRGRCGHGPWFRLMLHSVHRRAARLGWVKEVIKPGYAPDYKEGHPLSDEWRDS